MARILFLAHRIPYPPNKGDKIRSWHFLDHLAKTHTVHVGFYVDSKKDLQHIAFLENRFASVAWQYVGKLRQRLGMVWGLLTGKPLTTAAYPTGKLGRYASGLLASGDIDLVFLFSGAVAPLVPPSGVSVPLVTDLVDVDSAKWAQYALKARFPMSWIYRREARLLAGFEAQVAKRSAETLLVSAEEAELFRRTVANGDDIQVAHVNNGVDTGHFDPSRFPATSDSKTVIFTGAMDYEPNVEAAEWFVRHVWPMVKAECPDARFVIAGAPVHARVAALGAKDIAVLGFVDDMAEEISKASVVVAPLLTARGIQNKVLEGMAMGKAVVATPEAKEGIDAAAGQHLMVVKEADAFARTVSVLLQDAEKSAEIGRSARAHIEENYQWSSCLEKLDQVIDKALGQGG